MTQVLHRPRQHVVRFAGDSGDGIQLQGQQFTLASAISGHDLATLPDFPAEIRAPAGTRFGVSAFQIQFGGDRITTPGDAPDVLVALNPAALAVNLPELAPGTLIILDSDSFTQQRLKRARLDSNPLEDDTLSAFEVVSIDISSLTAQAVKPQGLGTKDAGRCKNFWVLGLVLWLFDQPREPTKEWLQKKFSAVPSVLRANSAALDAGHAYAETVEMSSMWYQRPTPVASLSAAEYRTITGAEALAFGLIAASEQANIDMLFCSYPITPASSLLHHLAGLQEIGINTFQAEDEIAAICSAIGVSYAGKLGVTSSSGPGIALKTEAMGLAIAAELPLVIINSQRSGPSTGMPTKTEQSDLYQAVYGRNGDAPIPVIAARSPKDCFDAAIEAVTIALRHMTPVMLLTDGYIASASELWALPDLDSYPPIITRKPESESAASINSNALLFERDKKTHARLWAAPDNANYIHRIGGLEKDINTGNISYDSANHQAMTDMRQAKVRSVADFIPPCQLELGTSGGIALVGWGSTYGTLHQVTKDTLQQGIPVAHIHLRHLHPLPSNLHSLLISFEQILVVEMNTGQLATILRDKLLLDVRQLNQVNGQPFAVATISQAISNLIKSTSTRQAN